MDSGLDALLLARLQFAANMTFHILFPTISIALGWALMFFKLRFNRTDVVLTVPTLVFSSGLSFSFTGPTFFTGPTLVFECVF